MTEQAEWDVVVVGGANTDYLVRGAKLPAAGETSEGEDFQEAPGGKGANQAIAAARLGARVAFVARIGDDARGESLLSRLQAEGVETRYIVRDPTAPTGVALIMVDQAGQKQILTSPGANRRLSVADIDAAAPALKGAKVVLSQLETPLESVRQAFHLGRHAMAKTVLDPAPAIPLPDELLRLIDVIRPNAIEAGVLTDVPVVDRASARRAAELLIRRGVGAVVVQAGDEGNLLVWREGEHWLPKLPVRTIDATGAGDAFAAALAVGLAEGKSLVEAATFGNAAAALATTQLGAQAGLPRRDAVLELLRKSGSRA